MLVDQQKTFTKKQYLGYTLTLESLLESTPPDEILKSNHSNEAIQQPFSVRNFIMQHSVILTFGSSQLKSLYHSIYFVHIAFYKVVLTFLSVEKMQHCNTIQEDPTL